MGCIKLERVRKHVVERIGLDNKPHSWMHLEAGRIPEQPDHTLATLPGYHIRLHQDIHRNQLHDVGTAAEEGELAEPKPRDDARVGC